MKTIKELEMDIYNAESCEEQDTHMYEESKKREIEILKDVLGLIDEMRLAKETQPRLTILNELKKRITG